MKANMGKADKSIRLSIFVIVLILFFTGVIGGTLGYILMGLAGVFLVTSLINFCPLYTLLGVNTCKVKK